MNRPSVEKDVFSEKHVKEEDYFKKDIENYWGCKLEKLPIDYRLDYAVIREGEIVAWIELKNRKLYSDQYQDSMINLNKWMKAKEFRGISDIPTLLAVRYKDLIKKQKYQIKMLQKDLYRMYSRIKNNE